MKGVTMRKDVKIPTMAKPWPEVERDYPISKRENIMRVFNHEKPKWMPDIYRDVNYLYFPTDNDGPANFKGDSCDWFGVQYQYSEAQGSPTPMVGVMDSVEDWKEKVIFPDVNALDWRKGLEDYVPDHSKAFACRDGNGTFERLHMLESFDNALTDIFLEPELCHELFERIAQYKIDLFDNKTALFDFDFFMINDDWGTAHGPFFSTELFEQTLLGPTLEYCRHIKEKGLPLAFHNCGKNQVFMPYLIDKLKADVLEIQPLNDLEAIFEEYGDRVSIIVQPDPYVMFDPDTTPEQARAHARELVDRYGAQRYRGGGALIAARGGFEETFYAFENELYEYSSKLYANL